MDVNGHNCRPRDDVFLHGIYRMSKVTSEQNFAMTRLHFLNETEELQQVGLTPTFPAKIVPIDLAKHLGAESPVPRSWFLAKFWMANHPKDDQNATLTFWRMSHAKLNLLQARMVDICKHICIYIHIFIFIYV